MCYHLRHKDRVGELYFVRTNMDVGYFRKNFGADLFHQIFQDFHSFL